MQRESLGSYSQLRNSWGQFDTRMSVTEAAIAPLSGQTVELNDFQRLEDQLESINPRLRQVEQRTFADCGAPLRQDFTINVRRYDGGLRSLLSDQYFR